MKFPNIDFGNIVLFLAMGSAFVVFPVGSAIVLALLLHPCTIIGYTYTLFYMLACALGLYMAVFFLFGVWINRGIKKGD